MTSSLLLLFYVKSVPPSMHDFLSFPAGRRDEKIRRGPGCCESVGDLWYCRNIPTGTRPLLFTLRYPSNLKLWKLMYKHINDCFFKRMSRSLAWALKRPARFKVRISSIWRCFLLSKKILFQRKLFTSQQRMKCSREFSLHKIPEAEQEMTLVDSLSFAYYYELL